MLTPSAGERISDRFLHSGIGWGGSCFLKDAAATRATARRQGYESAILNAAVEANDHQPERLLSLVNQHVDVADERIVVLRLAFKPGTDDVRNARAIPVIEVLRDRDAEVIAYDPVAAENMRKHLPAIDYAPTAEDALDDAVAAVIVTEWEEIAGLNEEFDEMQTSIVIDGRRAIDRRDGIVYEGLT